MISDQVLQKLEFFKILKYIASYTSTEPGEQLVLNLRPLNNIELIKEEGHFVNEAKEILIEKDYPPLNHIPVLENSLSKSKIDGAVLTKDEILAILNLAETSRKVFQFLKYFNETRIFNNLAKDLFVDKNFENHISRIFTANFEISDSASSNLKKIRKEIREKEGSLKDSIERILKRLSDAYLVQDEYVTQRDGRIVLPVKAEHKRHVKGFIHSESATGQTVYIEPEATLELNNELLSLKFEEKREIERIFKNITLIIKNSCDLLSLSLHKLAKIDEIFAKAKYSLEIIGAFPSFQNGKPLNIIEARHPILLKRLTRENTVPLNLKIGSNRIVIITGPNAGGKTVVLKTVGLIYTMVLSGIHAPVHPDTNLEFIEKIFIDIGDEQSIENDLSTFSSHLSNLKFIVEHSNKRTLVLLDEIGAGTDPSEGSALATAILLELKKKNSIVLATTHHGDLKLLANNFNGIENASMRFDTKNLVPTYQFNQGLPGSSYAFEVAAKIGLPENILNNARKYLDVDKNKIEQFLLEIEKKSEELNENLKNLEIENSRLKGLTNLYEKKINELKTRQKQILEGTREEAKQFMENLNRQFENTIKKIRETNAAKEVIKEEKKHLERLKSTAEKFVYKNEPDKDPDELKTGDFVRVKNSSAEGEIIEIDNEKKRITIQSGVMKFSLKMKDVYKTKRKRELKYEKEKYKPVIKSTRLDIRGEKPEEIEFQVIKFIDDAYASNLKQVEILHGKGTGILKQSVHELLKRHQFVSNFHFADIEFGGDGITVVHLK